MESPVAHLAPLAAAGALSALLTPGALPLLSRVSRVVAGVGVLARGRHDVMAAWLSSAQATLAGMSQCCGGHNAAVVAAQLPVEELVQAAAACGQRWHSSRRIKRLLREWAELARSHAL